MIRAADFYTMCVRELLRSTTVVSANPRSRTDSVMFEAERMTNTFVGLFYDDGTLKETGEQSESNI